MPEADTQLAAYVSEINQWRQTMDAGLRADDGWLTLIGLYWLHEGVNTIGSNSASDIRLSNVPDHVGTIEFQDGQASVRAATDVPLAVDGEPIRTALLRDDTADSGPSLVSIGSITLFAIRRGDQYGIRVRDMNNPARLSFTGRQWFPVDPHYQVTGAFIPYTPARTLQVLNAIGQMLSMSNPGRVEFVLHGQPLALEAFAAHENEIWFAFKDLTNGRSTYDAGRFLYASVGTDGSVRLDFNKAYHPPCAFTPYATCPRPRQKTCCRLRLRRANISNPFPGRVPAMGMAKKWCSTACRAVQVQRKQPVSAAQCKAQSVWDVCHLFA